MNIKRINILDCTLRDGGYYNNWYFKNNLIKSYLKLMNELQIKYIEFGFISFSSNLNNNGNINRQFINKFNFPKKIKIGVMINTKEMLNQDGKVDPKKIKDLFSHKVSNKISFIRFAFNFNEIEELLIILKDKRFKKFEIFLNLMQSSEINDNQLTKVIKLINKKKIKYFYLADSFGSYNNQSVKKIFKKLIKKYKHNIGFHAHDNLGLAYSNALTVLKQGVNFIDSTLMGMGRGAGNLKTEMIYNFLYREKDFEKIKNFNNKYFNPLLKKYNWGKNEYYKYAGINKIHPTYVQEILTNKIYNKKDYFKILNHLKKTDTKKFDPYNLYNFNHFNINKKYTLDDVSKYFKNEKIIILGPSKINNQVKIKVTSLIQKSKYICIAINRSNSINEKLIEYRVTSHPQRILSDMNFLMKNKTKKIIPLSLLKKKIIKKLLKKSKILNYGLILKRNIENYKASKKFCILEKPLAILYILSILEISEIKKLLLVGFKGYEKDNPFQDNTQKYLLSFVKRNPNVNIKILKPSIYTT